MKKSLFTCLLATSVALVLGFSSFSKKVCNYKDKQAVGLTTVPVKGMQITGDQLYKDFQKYDSLEIDVDISYSPAKYIVYGFYGVSGKDDITSHFPPMSTFSVVKPFKV